MQDFSFGRLQKLDFPSSQNTPKSSRIRSVLTASINTMSRETYLAGKHISQHYVRSKGSSLMRKFTK